MIVMKRGTFLILIITIIISTVSVTQAADVLQFFPQDHILNTPVDTLPVDPMSNAYIQSDLPNGPISLNDAFPINVVDNSVKKQKLTSIEYGWMSDNVLYPIPDNAMVEQADSGDYHMLIVNPETNYLYEMFYARKATDGTWSAKSAVVWNLSDYTLRMDGNPAACTSGVPMAAGIIRYDEVASGEVKHAALLSLPRGNMSHVWPARSNGEINNPAYPPMGQRFRLKSSFDTSGYSPYAKTILEGFKKYGLIYSMNSGADATAWIVAGEQDDRWQTVMGFDWDSFVNLHASDFEAVDVSSLMINKNSAQARTVVAPMLAARQ